MICDAISRMIPTLTPPQKETQPAKSTSTVKCVENLLPHYGAHFRDKRGNYRCCRNAKPVFEDSCEGAQTVCDNCGTVFHDWNAFSEHSGELSYSEKEARLGPALAGRLSKWHYNSHWDKETAASHKLQRRNYAFYKSIKDVAQFADHDVDRARAEMFLRKFVQNKGQLTDAAAVAAVVLSQVHDFDALVRTGFLPEPPKPQFKCHSCDMAFHMKRDLRFHERRCSGE